MNTLTFLRYICAGLAIATSVVLAQSGQTVERYSKLPASADGIGKGYMGREIAAETLVAANHKINAHGTSFAQVRQSTRANFLLRNIGIL